MERKSSCDSSSAHQYPVYLPGDNAYAPVADINIENESGNGKERFNPDGASNVVDFSSIGYKRCHYTLPAKIRRKIKATSKKPHQIYIEQKEPVNEKAQNTLNRKKCLMKKANDRKVCDDKKYFRYRQDETDDERAENGSLLLSQISSDYAGAWSDDHTNTQASCNSLHRDHETSDYPDEQEEPDKMIISFPERNELKGDGAEEQVLNVVPDGPMTEEERELDWDSSDDGDEDGYKKRATQIEQMEWDSSDDDEDEDGYKKRATKIEQYFVDSESSEDDNGKT